MCYEPNGVILMVGRRRAGEAADASQPVAALQSGE